MRKAAVNPFIVGDWIRKDEDFFGRQDLIAKYTALEKKAYWLMGARRMGKTSLLRKVQRSFRKRGNIVAVFWDVSGVSHVQELQNSLLDALDSAHDDFIKAGIVLDPEELESMSPDHILKQLRIACRHQNKKIVFLIDESESLFQMSGLYPDFIRRLKHMLLDHETFHVILASNHGLACHDKLNTQYLAADFLQSFLPPDYLTPVSLEEAAPLIKRLGCNEKEMLRIFHDCGGLPFLIQMVCYYVFDAKDIDVAFHNIQHGQFLDLFFRHDINFLDGPDFQIMSLISSLEPVNIYRLGTALQESPQLLAGRLRILQVLGLAAITPDAEYKVNNVFLKRWLKSNVQLGEEKKKDLDQQESVIIIIDLEQVTLIGPDEQRISYGFDASALQMLLPQLTAVSVENKALFKKAYDILFRSGDGKDRVAAFAGGSSSLVFTPRFHAWRSIAFEGLHDGQSHIALKRPLSRGCNPFSRYHHDNFDRMHFLLIAADTPPDIVMANQEILLLKDKLETAAGHQNLSVKVTALLSGQSDWSQIRTVMKKEEITHIHYAGHIRPQHMPFLYFRDEAQVAAVSLTDFFAAATSPLSFVYLNSCDGALSGPDLCADAAACMHQYEVRALLGMQSKVDDRFSAEFALDFYHHYMANDFSERGALAAVRKRWADNLRHYSGRQAFWTSPVLIEKF